MTPPGPRKGFRIVGGLGPLAGADIFLKLVRSTPAESDKEHFDVVFEQRPFEDGNAVADAHYNATPRKLHVFNIIKGLEHRRVDAVMLTCFISHTFFDELAPEVELPIVNIMEALRAHVGIEYPRVTRLGVLTSSYVMTQRLFERYFEADRYALVYPDQEIQDRCVMEAIYGPRGIKAGELGDAPVELIQRACRNLVDQGAEIIIPGFTEIPVVIDGLCRGVDVPIVDSNEVYAEHAIFSQLRSGPKQFKVGIIGGVGPAATVDFMNKIVAHTDAGRDQDHLKLVVEHNPQIPDRTDNLMGEGMDPTISLYSACKKLESNDADVIAIPCNTAHAFIERIQRHLTIPILEMPFEAVRYVSENYPRCKHIGLLATTGTVRSRVYHDAAAEVNLELIVPDETFQEKVMDVIYGERGVKAGYVDGDCRAKLLDVVDHLVGKGVTAVLLGCTELPLVLSSTEEPVIGGKSVVLLDPTEILAEKCVALKNRSVVES